MGRFLGEFEQMVLLAILQQEGQAFALEVRREIERSTGRKVARGGFYTTLERLEGKGYVRWEEAVPADERTTSTLHRFEVTPEGLAALRSSLGAMARLTRGLDGLLEGA